MNRKLVAAGILVIVVIGGLSTVYLRDKLLQKRQQPVQVSEASPTENQPSSSSNKTTSAESSEQAPTVDIEMDKQKLIGVKTVPAIIRTLEKTIRATGRVDYEEQHLSTVNARFQGWIEKLFVNKTGQHVQKGDPLAEIYSPELLATQQEFLDLLKWQRGKSEEPVGSILSQDTDNLLNAAKRRLQLWDISDAQIRRLEETGKPMRTLTIFSKVSGYVIQKNAVLGMKIEPGEKLFDIADLSTVWIIADVFEQELSTIKIGQKAKVTLSAFPQKEFLTSVEYIYPTLTGETRTAKIRFTVNNANGMLKPQMFTNVDLTVNLGRHLAIPDDAIIDTGERQIVYVDLGEGSFEPREVLTGVKADGYTEITKGLHAGEKVVATATFLIDSEAQLKGVRPLK